MRRILPIFFAFLLCLPASQSWEMGARMERRLVAATAGGGGYDTDAQDYFTRAEALGGSFDQSGSGYSEATVKGAISDFVATCKTDGTWSKLIEVYLTSGGTFSGITAKLKYAVTATLTNNGFVTGDYAGVGSGAGITGDLTSYFDTNCLLDVYSTTLSLGVYYSATTSTSAERYGIGGYDNLVGAGARHGIYHQAGSVRRLQVFITQSSAMNLGSPDLNGFAVVSYRSSTDVEGYRNGTSIATDSSTETLATSSAQTFYLMAHNNSGTAASFSDCTVSFAFVGDGLTDTDVSNLSTAVNTLMTALGCNVY